MKYFVRALRENYFGQEIIIISHVSSARIFVLLRFAVFSFKLSFKSFCCFNDFLISRYRPIHVQTNLGYTING